MTGGLLKILTITNIVGAGVNTVTISPDGRLVATGCDDAVRDL